MTLVDRWCLAVAVTLVAAGAFHLGVFVIDDRPWSGPVSWRKPFTFGEAFGLTLATVAWVSRPLTISASTRARLLTIFAAADCGSAVERVEPGVRAEQDPPVVLVAYSAGTADSPAASPDVSPQPSPAPGPTGS